MPTYDPTTQPGQTRRRISVLWGYNKLSEMPRIDFQEQEVVRLGDGAEAHLRDTRAVSVAYTPGLSIPLRDPISDAVIGTITHDQIFAAIYALGRQAQLDADAAEGAG